ncbi:ABC transporter permease [Peribacillus kribbensis]|uniref:ABC transporter permease n=1 Tax=Peribacillus kribbensis TaxID=356658 RepID=UPI00047CFF1C|nr:ABC transporter permease [Peribacillus kribbensis]
MRKLIMLEIKKFQLQKYWKNVMIANMVAFVLLISMNFTEEKFADYQTAFAAVSVLVRAIFTIFTAVIISKLIIDEYRSGSIALMFMYPIQRKKIILSKLIIVAGFAFSSIFLSTIFVDGFYYLANSLLHLVPGQLTAEVIATSARDALVIAAVSAGISLIPLYFGMRKKSVPATIVTAVILVSLTSSTMGEQTAFSFMAIPTVLAIVGFAAAWLSFRNIEKADI